MTRDDYEFEQSASPEDAAAVLSAVTDGLLAGSIRLGEGDDAVAADVPATLSLEVEFERDGDELSLELELEWTDDGDDGGEPADGSTGEAEASDEAIADDTEVPVGAADGSQSLARFEVFEDKAGEFRWRLRHRNGNVIASSGEGYTRKHNAWKGLRSVMKNAPGAEVVEE